MRTLPVLAFAALLALALNAAPSAAEDPCPPSRETPPASGEAAEAPKPPPPAPSVSIAALLDGFRADASGAAALYRREGGTVITGSEIRQVINASEHSRVVVLGVPASEGGEKEARAVFVRCWIEAGKGIPETDEALEGYRAGDSRTFTGTFLEMGPAGLSFACFDTLAMDAAIERIVSGK
ncbi:MAG: hypothetical protein LBQ12_12585 [Deltaproteobacteria bacterium]|nr:hypothetical protein [Deltaproteobacteria bacterium]